MRPNSTNVDATDLPDARRKFEGDEKMSDFIPIASVVGGQRFQQLSCPLEATTDRSNTDGLRTSTPRPQGWYDLTRRILNEYSDASQDLMTFQETLVGYKIVRDRLGDIRQVVTGDRERSETMDEEPRDYPSRPQPSRPNRRRWECRVEQNRESVTPRSILPSSADWFSVPRILMSTHCDRSYINESTVAQLGLRTEYTGQENSIKPDDAKHGKWQGEKKRKLETLHDITWTCLGALSHAPLAIASGGAYHMRKWSSDSGRYEFVHRIAEGSQSSGHTPDTFGARSLPLHFAAIATTSFSLTAHHYILVQQGRDRDLLLLVFVGVGALAGSLAGLDGVEIVMRVVPWCTIVVFWLCAFVLPPRAQKSMRLQAGGMEELRKGATDAVIPSEKEAKMDSGGSEGSKPMVGSETKTEGSEITLLV